MQIKLNFHNVCKFIHGNEIFSENGGFIIIFGSVCIPWINRKKLIHKTKKRLLPKQLV